MAKVRMRWRVDRRDANGSYHRMLRVRSARMPGVTG